MSDETPLSAGLVIDPLTFERLGPVIGHLSVGLLESVQQITLITEAKAALNLSLGPVQVLRHRALRWPLWKRGVHRIAAELSTSMPAIFHAFSQRSLSLGSELATATGRPLVAHLLSTEDVTVGGGHEGHHANKLIAGSQPLFELAVQRTPPDEVVLIRPGLLAAASPVCFSRSGLMPTILCMSAFEPNTGVDRLIRAVATLVQEGHEMMLLLLGSGPIEADLRKLVERRNLIKHVTFGQRLPDWDLVMRTADIFVVPGDVNRVDVRLLHALAAGLAAVTCKVPNSDFIIDGQTGLICADTTDACLAATIRRLLRDPELARRLAGTALDYCKEHHSLSRMAERTAKIYREVIAQHPVASS